MSFIEDVFECGDTTVHILNPNDRGAHLDRLKVSAAEDAAHNVEVVASEAWINDIRIDHDDAVVWVYDLADLTETSSQSSWRGESDVQGIDECARRGALA